MPGVAPEEEVAPKGGPTSVPLTSCPGTGWSFEGTPLAPSVATMVTGGAASSGGWPRLRAACVATCAAMAGLVGSRRSVHGWGAWG